MLHPTNPLKALGRNPIVDLDAVPPSVRDAVSSPTLGAKLIKDVRLVSVRDDNAEYHEHKKDSQEPGDNSTDAAKRRHQSERPQ